MKIIITCLIIAFNIVKCKTDRDITEFSVNGVECEIKGDSIYGLVPLLRTGLIASFKTPAVATFVEGIKQVSDSSMIDFTRPVKYVTMNKDSLTKIYTVFIKEFTGLPILYINTEAPIVDKDNYIKGRILINGNLEYQDTTAALSMKGRGNSTWPMPKKPYKLKFDNKIALLGMPADKEWALLANYYDKSMLRNDIIFEMGERLGMPWTPKRKFVELYLNGDYQGNYLLTESVKTAKERINISVMDPKKDTSGGYLLEANFRMDEITNFITKYGMRFSFKEPEIPTAAQLKKVTDVWYDIEEKMNNENEIFKYIDSTSWVKYTLIEEFASNPDFLFGSNFFYRDKVGLIKAGPLWDFDLSLGEYPGNHPEDWVVGKANIFGSLTNENQTFRQIYKRTWNEYKDTIKSILDSFVDSRIKYLKESRKKNEDRWHTINLQTYEGQEIPKDYEDEVDKLKNFMKVRWEWLDIQINKF